MQGVRLVELGDLYFDVSLLLWCCSLVWLTQQGLCSAYVPMLMVAFPLATRLLLAKEFKHRGEDASTWTLWFAPLCVCVCVRVTWRMCFFFLLLSAGASMKYSMLYLLGLALPYVHFMFLVWVVFEIFTPIMGRSGTEIPPELVLASLVTLTTIFLSSFFVSASIVGAALQPVPRLA